MSSETQLRFNFILHLFRVVPIILQEFSLSNFTRYVGSTDVYDMSIYFIDIDIVYTYAYRYYYILCPYDRYLYIQILI